MVFYCIMYVMAKKSYVPILAHITERVSEIHDCEYNGKECLRLFIITRVNQPRVCLNCLRELGVRQDYIRIKCGILTNKMVQYTYMQTEYEIINKETGEVKKVTQMLFNTESVEVTVEGDEKVVFDNVGRVGDLVDNDTTNAFYEIRAVGTHNKPNGDPADN